MNMRITIPNDIKRFNNSDGRRFGNQTQHLNESKRLTNSDGRRFGNQSHNRLENGDQRRVSFSAPTTAPMNVDGYDDHDNGNEFLENEQHLLDTG